jgi:hypothetical protein
MLAFVVNANGNPSQTPRPQKAAAVSVIVARFPMAYLPQRKPLPILPTITDTGDAFLALQRAAKVKRSNALNRWYHWLC